MKGLKSFETLEYHARAVNKALGNYGLEDVTPLALQRVILQWRKTGRKPATINRRLHVIRQILKHALLEGYISSLPEITQLSERGNERQGFFSEEEFQALYKELPDYLADVTQFAYLSGWRKSEILSLTWSCMDWNSMVLRLPTSKNGESRVFPIVNTTMEALLRKRLQKRQGDLIFHRGGQPLGDFKRAWKSANKRAGMNKLFHDLRRTAVRNFIAQGLPERLVMALCGHKTNHMLHRYHVLVEADLREALLAQK